MKTAVIHSYNGMGDLIWHLPYIHAVARQTKEHIEANIFVHWSNIKTLMHYPDRKGFDFPSEFDKDIGFKIKE